MLAQLAEHGVAVADQCFGGRVVQFRGNVQAGGTAVQSVLTNQLEQARGDRGAGDKPDLVLSGREKPATGWAGSCAGL